MVLACGALENARILLASNDVERAGIGNHAGMVGRFYMSHLSGAFAWAKLRDVDRGLIYDFERHGGVYVRRRFWISPQAQQREAIGNAIAFFFRPPLQLHLDAALTGLSPWQSQNALHSAVFLARYLRGVVERRSVRAMMRGVQQDRNMLSKHLSTVLAQTPHLIPQAAAIIRQRYFAKRRLPFVLPPKKDNRFYLFYQTEQAPHPESRVMLHGERDALGMPRLETKIHFTDLDIRTVIRTHYLIRRQFEKTGTGELNYEESALKEKLKDDICNFNSFAHHIGTTRMSRDREDGVVDCNCRVHGVTNLFVAGSSVFATSGHANPTLTFVALALRLADHLKGR